jgi:16S rRNA (uracil1498-N3)-methyltransferase
VGAPRFYIRPENWTNNAPVLAGAEAHHARDVLRLRAGDQAVLFDGRGHELTAEISEIGRREIRFSVIQEREAPPRACRIILAQAIPKGKNMDLIVQKAVELGAAEIVPIISERTVVSLNEKERRSKQAKWQQIVIEACKQCRQNWMPEVREPIALKQLFSEKSSATPHPRERTKPDLGLIASTRDDSLHLREVLRRFESKHEARPARVTVLVGPEGDFTPSEYGNAAEAGFQAITLGPIILRVETAAIYCLSVLSYELLGLKD